MLNNYESSSSQQQAPIVSWNDGLNVSDSTTNRFENVSKMKEIQQNLFKGLCLLIESINQIMELLILFLYTEQDQNIDSLTNVITRQKYLAREIDSELTVQNG